MKSIETDDADLLARFARGERRALARVLSRVEQDRSPVLPAGSDSSRSMPVIGITGSGGAGKSTLVNALVQHLRSLRLLVAVLACDPASPRTGGALLGDRVRTQFDPADQGFYFRSFSTRGAMGGISLAIPAAIDWLRAFGFDVVLIETVGIGQDQVAVRDVVDTLVLLVTPQTGDEVQWEKAGIIEVADVVVVNKSDLSGAAAVRQQVERALRLSAVPGDPHMTRPVPVLNVTATTNEGVPELWQVIRGQASLKAPRGP